MDVSYARLGCPGGYEACPHVRPVPCCALHSCILLLIHGLCKQDGVHHMPYFAPTWLPVPWSVHNAKNDGLFLLSSTHFHTVTSTVQHRHQL